MKTILIAHNYSKDSFSYMSYKLANYLSNNGFRVVFISHKPYFKEEKKTVNKNGELILTSWNSFDKRPTGLKDFLHFFKIYKKYKPSYIIGHFVGANISILGSKLFSLGKVKCFIYYHTLSNQIFKDLKTNNLKYNLKKNRKMVFFKLFVDNYICPSELAKKDIIKTFRVNQSKSVVVLNAIEDRKNIFDKVSKEKIFNKVSYLGRLDPSKNVKLLIETFIDFKKDNLNSKLTLSIAGSGKESTEIESICSNYNFFNFKGGLSYDKVDDFLSNTDYTIIPSVTDNLPTVE